MGRPVEVPDDPGDDLAIERRAHIHYWLRLMADDLPVDGRSPEAVLSAMSLAELRELAARYASSATGGTVLRLIDELAETDGSLRPTGTSEGCYPK
jgi:hypothetical protein